MRRLPLAFRPHMTMGTFAAVGIPIMVVTSLIWVGLDAKQRGRNPLWIGLLCFLTWPFGFLVWHGVRPPRAVEGMCEVAK
jgi:hypothetical protein